jgi:very-short-patch-repair endonuclease
VAAKERTERARGLRLNDSRAEQEVWEFLRAHRMGGLKFRRQHPIGPYFADFACVARKLAIEIDSEHHALQREADSRRTDLMEQAGWRVIRFSASEVVQNTEGVWAEIARVLGIER